MQYEDLKMVNCAGCDTELLGTSMVKWWSMQTRDTQLSLPSLVDGHILGRPYCRRCLHWRRPRGHTIGIREESPLRENAVRQLEDG